MAKQNRPAENALDQVLENSRQSSSRSDRMVAHRRVIIMRHSEKCDDVYPDFVQLGFPNGGDRYVQFDLNMPEKLPQRHEDINTSKQDWQADPPLTNMGHKTAAAIGAEYAHLNVAIEYVFSSPALRCVQTAGRFIEGYQKVNKMDTLKVKIEGGLFEWQFNTGSPTPRFIAEQDLAKGGLPIDMNYKCFKQGNSIAYNETFEGFNQRCVDTMRYIMDSIPTGATVLFITHAPNFDMFNRYRGTGGMPTFRWQKLVNRVPYLHAIAYDEVRKNHWEMRPPPVCSFPYESNASYNWENPGRP
ncbi:His Phos 1 domain containing protein [Trichuris trichiura]|uniref:His Phos 1 domain containing protein n=1 Tax=Trichuris trichiura TaxID=36087 RepID=A0A077ZH74_TRITR|nr:His Phos 1 domain containing protein [Trichuris trichiura]